MLSDEPSMTVICQRSRGMLVNRDHCMSGPGNRFFAATGVQPVVSAGVETVFDAHVDPGLIERSLEASTFGSMWLDMPRPDYPPLTGSITADLLVVGGGYTGLWTALHAAQRNPDQRIVLIDANRIGWAASGRNGGFVDASLTHGLENGKSRWPNEIDTLNAMGLENLDGMQADIEQLGLDTEWQRTGMLSVATEPHQVACLQQAGADGEGRLLGLQEVRDEVHSPTYLAGLFNADTTAIVHPAKRRRPLPFPPEPLASIGIQATR